jgi:hypothetical protein
MTRQNHFIASALGMLIFGIPGLAGANYCVVDGTNFPNTSVITASQLVIFGGNLCGHSIYGSGCTVNADIDGTWSATSDCLSLGRGVTINGNPNGTGRAQITCTSTHCGSAFDIVSSAGSGSTTVTDVDVDGCFRYGARGSGANVAKVLNSTIDLAYGSCGALAAIYGIHGVDTVDTVEVKNANVGIMTYQTVKNSVVHDCNTAGIETQTSSNANLVNVFVHDNPYSLSRASGTGVATLNDSTFANASTCHTYNAATSTCLQGIVSFSGAATFFDGELH